MKRSVEFLAGSTVVYLVMASCSATRGEGPSLGDGGDPPEGAYGQGGAPVAMAGASGRSGGSNGAGPGGGSGGTQGVGGGFAGADGGSTGTSGGSAGVDGGLAGEGGKGGEGGEGGRVTTAGSGGAGGLGGILNPVPDADADTSGTRLKARVLVGADGSKQPTHRWQDTLRNEECTFRLAADGTQRCMPTSVATAYSVFSDPGCTSPAALLFSPCPQPPAYLSSAPLTCNGFGGERLYQRGASLSTYYSGSPASCQAVPVSQYNVVFALGPEVPLDSFVSAQVTVEP
jgi:hypothetical protein